MHRSQGTEEEYKEAGRVGKKGKCTGRYAGYQGKYSERQKNGRCVEVKAGRKVYNARSQTGGGGEKEMKADRSVGRKAVGETTTQGKNEYSRLVIGRQWENGLVFHARQQTG